ncbi:MAG: hypothetical protein KDD36_11985 [Flavobacteriales bacterium]|nr:hypothetical protein [Flavobacteriales bacterium]
MEKKDKLRILVPVFMLAASFVYGQNDTIEAPPSDTPEHTRQSAIQDSTKSVTEQIAMYRQKAKKQKTTGTVFLVLAGVFTGISAGIPGDLPMRQASPDQKAAKVAFGLSAAVSTLISLMFYDTARETRKKADALLSPNPQEE